ncbi:MAG: sulfatase-like hydrolase/transferase, partial [Gimesia chilikensis]
AANFKEMADKDHQPSYRFRGHKADIYEGGHRVPFIANWPARVKAGTHSDQLICLTDLMATAADIVGAKLPDNAGEDSVSILPALEGKDTQPLREAAVHHSIRGAFSIRKDHWKLELCPGSGGWSFPKPGKEDLSQLPPIQLYDLNADLNEQKNLQSEYPEVVKELTDLLQSYVDRGRSTPGAPQENNGDVDIFEAGKSAQKMKRPQKKKPAKAKS